MADPKSNDVVLAKTIVPERFSQYWPDTYKTNLEEAERIYEVSLGKNTGRHGHNIGVWRCRLEPAIEAVKKYNIDELPLDVFKEMTNACQQLAGWLYRQALNLDAKP